MNVMSNSVCKLLHFSEYKHWKNMRKAKRLLMTYIAILLIKKKTQTFSHHSDKVQLEKVFRGEMNTLVNREELASAEGCFFVFD